MKETKLVKRIFAGFVAFIVILLIACGDLQTFASSAIHIPYISSTSPSWSTLDNSGLSVLVSSSGNRWTLWQTRSSDFLCCVGLVLDNGIWSVFVAQASKTSSIRFCTLQYDGTISASGYASSSLFVQHNNYFYFWPIASPDSGFDPVDSDLVFISESSFLDYCDIYFGFVTPTPEPTPTPTPTPDPTPTAEPTFNPDQPTYYTFFNHLLNDGNNALNALYLSWTSANNKFYTGIFFIGLPIMIGIFGIVASIFFGGDD